MGGIPSRPLRRFFRWRSPSRAIKPLDLLRDPHPSILPPPGIALPASVRTFSHLPHRYLAEFGKAQRRDAQDDAW
ncbi:hypothetical protein D3C85_748780 [compost metagenome]